MGEIDKPHKVGLVIIRKKRLYWLGTNCDFPWG
jgi:hypothetical protein